MGELPDELPQVTTDRNRRMRYTASAAVAAALAGALTFSLVSCASGSDGAAPAPSVTTSETAAPTSNATSTADPNAKQFETGAIVDAATAKELNKAKGETRAWEMSDNTWVAVNVNDPVPQPILDEVAASMKGNADHQFTSTGMQGLLDRQLGRYECAIWYGVADPRGYDWVGAGWNVATFGHDQVTFATQEEAVAQCESWAADAGATSRLAITVAIL